MSPTPIGKVRLKMRRAKLRRDLEAVVAGKKTTISLRLDDYSLDLTHRLHRFMQSLPRESVERQRLNAALEKSGVINAALDGIVSSNWRQRVRSARMAGVLELEIAVPWLALLLASSHYVLLEPAARALGRVGGWRSAEALITGIRLNGPSRIFITALADAAPDLFVEAGLSRAGRPAVINALALAAGLRRRHAAIGPLSALLVRGNRAQRAISCRSLGWIGARTAVPLITEALSDREWQVRMSAIKALVALEATEATPKFEMLLRDRHRRVRKTALLALRRLEDKRWR